MILVVGATGFLGGEICRRLIATGRAVRGLARPTSDGATVTSLKTLGVEMVEGDLRDRSSLDAACRGSTTVITTATATRTRQPGESIESTDWQGQSNLVDAAREAGVSRYVYVSYSGQLGVDDPLTRAKRSVEQRVRESGMRYTILRPSYFMESWLGPHLGFDYPNARATVYGSGENKVSWISLRDVAEFAVRVLEDPDAENKVIELGGPDALGPLEVVRIFEQAGGRPFEVRHVPEETLRAQRASATDSHQETFAALMLALAQGDPIPMDETLRRYPLQLTSVRDYARAVLTT